MNKQIKYLLGVLIVLLISAYFISLLSGLPQFFKEDIIAFLEERVSGEISFSSVSLWPLNRLRLNSFSFEDQNGSKFKVEQLNLDYKLNFKNFDKLISVKFIEAKKAEIAITEEFLPINIEAETETKNSDLQPTNQKLKFNLADFKLPEFMSGININILDAKLSLQNQNYNLKFDNLKLGLKAEDQDNYQLNLSTAFSINNFNYGEYNFAELEGENLDLKLQRNDKQAEIYFNTSSLPLQVLTEFMPQNNYNYQNFNVDLATLNGQFRSQGQIKLGQTEIIDYQTEINFDKLNFKADYLKQEQSFDFAASNLNLIISGPQVHLAAVDNSFSLDNNQIDFSLKVNQDLDYRLKLKAEEFDYNYNLIDSNLKSGKFAFDFDLKGESGSIEQAEAEIEAESIDSKYAEITDSYFLFKFSEAELFMEKAELSLANNSQLKLQGNYDLEDNNYLLSAEAKDWKISNNLLSLLEEFNLEAAYIEQFKKVENDSLDFSLDTAGYYSLNRGVSSAGNFDFTFDFADKANDFNLKSEFWYLDQKLFFNSLKFSSDFVYLDLLGEIDFASQKLDLRYALKNFEPAVLNKNFNLGYDFLKTINPTIKYAEGRISDNFDNPTLSMDLKLDQLSYQNYAFENIDLKAVYKNDNLNLTEAKADLNQGLLRASGKIENLSESVMMDLNIKSENLYFQDLAQNSEQELPLSGAFNLEAELSGPLADYNLNFKFDTSSTVVNYQDQEFELSNLSSTIKKEGQNFKIENLSFEQQNLVFEAAGIYNLDTGFDLNYQLQGIELQNYLNDYPQLSEKVSGSLALKGKLLGKLEALKLNFALESKDLIYDEMAVEIKENEFEYSLQAENLAIKDFSFNFASGLYQLQGDIFNLNSSPQSELELELVEVPSREFFQKYLSFYPFAQDLIFKGKTQIQTKGTEFSAAVNINAQLAQTEEKVLSLKGKFGDGLALEFEASRLPIDFSATQYDFNLKTEAELDFSGSVNGSLASPILSLEHQLDSIVINNTALQSINGDILLESRRRFSASETINFKEGGNLDIDGSYSFEDKEISLSSNLQTLPISFLLSFFGDQLRGSGQLNGGFRAEGNLEQPKLSGNLKIDGNLLEVGIWNSIENYEGEIVLNNNQALIKNLTGEFGTGNFQVGGSFNLLDRANFWDLTLSGEKLYFDYGSLNGDFDTKLEFSGPLLNPLLAGEIEIYDFLVGIPFKWPAGNQEIKEDAFMPRINLDIIPRQNTRVKNPNMDVLIQNGDLNINFNHRRENYLMMEGRLRSSEGRFNYYNSRFILNSAEVLFSPVDERDIPNLRVNATTYAGGREINIVLNGPADNMRISLSSIPEMTEEEILSLLSSRGALGSAVIGGEDIGVQQIITQELLRIVNGFLQEDLISDIESEFRTALSLDRIEIDVLQYGIEREFAIYLGKNLSRKLYLEYASFFQEEEVEQEISFQYKLTELTNLKGTYFGDNEYEITIESEIEF